MVGRRRPDQDPAIDNFQPHTAADVEMVQVFAWDGQAPGRIQNGHFFEDLAHAPHADNSGQV